MLASCVHMQEEGEVQDQVLLGRAWACLRRTSQTTCGDGAAMERWSTRARRRAVRRAGRWARQRAEAHEGAKGFADHWAWSGQAFARLQLVALGVSDEHAVGAPASPNRRGQESDERREESLEPGEACERRYCWR